MRAGRRDLLARRHDLARHARHADFGFKLVDDGRRYRRFGGCDYQLRQEVGSCGLTALVDPGVRPVSQNTKMNSGAKIINSSRLILSMSKVAAENDELLQS